MSQSITTVGGPAVSLLLCLGVACRTGQMPTPRPRLTFPVRVASRFPTLHAGRAFLHEYSAFISMIFSLDIRSREEAMARHSGRDRNHLARRLKLGACIGAAVKHSEEGNRFGNGIPGRSGVPRYRQQVMIHTGRRRSISARERAGRRVGERR